MSAPKLDKTFSVVAGGMTLKDHGGEEDSSEFQVRKSISVQFYIYDPFTIVVFFDLVSQ